MKELVEMKTCTQCLEDKPYSEFYAQNKITKTKGKYIYYNPKCKRCVIGDTLKWMEDNPAKYLKNRRRHDDKEERKERKKIINRNRAESGKYLEWQQNNKDKVKVYSQKRWSNKKHNIPEKEWIRCKEYFDYLCAYCGMSEVNHKKRYKQQLHKEHVIHDGRDDIKNCVPSCKSCNGSKHVKTLNEWYNKMNPDYSYERYLKIYQWIRYDYKFQ